MKQLPLLFCVCCLATALPRFDDDDDIDDILSHDFVKIIRDDRVPPLDGKYAFSFETEDGIIRSESGSRNPNTGALIQQGQYSFKFPDGEQFTLKFVADENGFQPESPFLPVAPAFPHPIPQFVLDQIEKARLEDLDRDDRDDDDSSRGRRKGFRDDDDD